MIDKCNKCGRIFESREEAYEVTCKYITFWEHDTKRYLCSKCYEKFKKYMKKHYEKFFTYLKENKQ